MLDRSLPLAERVLAMFLCWSMDDAHEAARAELLAEIAAADRLARAMSAQIEAGDDSTDWGKDHPTEHAAQRAREAEYNAALAAYLPTQGAGLLAFPVGRAAGVGR
jgi:hypothetical protein